jgi:hypothetical protein
MFFSRAAQISPLITDLALQSKTVVGRIFGCERGKLTKGKRKCHKRDFVMCALHQIVVC